MWKETAAAQSGILTRRQAHEGGLTDEAVEARLASCRWQRVYLGVLATFGGPLPRANPLLEGSVSAWNADLGSGCHIGSPPIVLGCPACQTLHW